MPKGRQYRKVRVMQTQTLIDHCRERLGSHGFDLVQPFATATYNRAPLAQSSSFRLPDFGRPSALALVVGNGRALWQRFVAAYQREPEIAASRHPLNEHTESSLHRLRDSLAVRSVCFFSHHSEPRIPIQRVADVAGLAELAPCHMSVHPELGPWLGLRAVLVVDAPPPQRLPPTPARQCPGCHRPCLAALSNAVSQPPGAADSWRAWLQLRDSCPVGRQARYGSDQIHYHYTKDRSILDR